MRSRIEALAVVGLPFAVAALSGPPSLQRMLTASGDPTAPIVGALAWVAWACSAWLLVVIALGRLANGGWFAAVSQRLAPASVRALVQLAVGATAASLLVAGPALAANAELPSPVVPAPIVPVEVPADLDWPSSPLPTSTPTSTPPAAPAPPTTALARPNTAAQRVVVQPGESLWSIAARHLPQATEREVAVAWPQWWVANRAVVGPDPDLIFPGTVLHAPTATQGEP